MVIDDLPAAANSGQCLPTVSLNCAMFHLGEEMEKNGDEAAGGNAVEEEAARL